MLPLIRTFCKKVFPPLLISGILLFYAWLVCSASQVPLPSSAQPLLFYSNQTQHDIKLAYCQALKHASQSIFLSVYGISDPQILELLSKKSRQGLNIRVEYDPTASVNLKKILPGIALSSPKTKGLMHRKIAVLDHSQVFLGSANLTTTSLRHHANLVLGLYNPDLAAYLENPPSPFFSFELAGQQGELFLLPDPRDRGFTHLIETMRQANKKIFIAMFTLTHPGIVETLIQAKKRGIDVHIAVDYYTAKGASHKAVAALQNAGIKVYLSQGRELLHHKWAVIDDTILAMGSANWTKAAFSKNHDFLLFLSPLQKNQQQFLKKLWTIIEAESVKELKLSL